MGVIGSVFVKQPRLIGAIWGMLMLAAPLKLLAADNPSCAPKTPMEEVYCQIRAKGEGQDLPNFYEFRKNPEVTQALLLKREAQKLSIPLPAVKAKKAAPSTPSTSAPVSDKAPVFRENTAAKENRSNTRRDLKPVAGDLQNCRLQAETVSCNGQAFILQLNLPNSALSAGALTSANRLLLAPAPPASPEQAEAYLVSSYTLYINKMLDIGLAAATLTFGKFAGIYAEISQMNAAKQKVDFAARFATMYEFLQKDKRNMQAPRRFTSALPSGLDRCYRLSASLIICDEQGINWVYKLTI